MVPVSGLARRGPSRLRYAPHRPRRAFATERVFRGIEVFTGVACVGFCETWYPTLTAELRTYRPKRAANAPLVEWFARRSGLVLDMAGRWSLYRRLQCQLAER